ncbi:DUF5018 domain-containing protein [Arcicella rigui]|uniref:DUF5018 domain-containing protein n=1 Tax=Arcicella rigui TaxID=797020 RepID=A0ABU5QAB6_9BACT|nr:DUF5018 domain-containing protein [Arcicella rigui]MEA5139780.1 DUF5018 domain-containing protein [Arcicella rigui]
MKSIFTKIILFYLPIMLLLMACNEEIIISKSSQRKITKFSFSGLTPVVDATIDEANKKITAVVPATIDISKLIPTITVSLKAKLSPETGKAQDFSNDITYTVTAEDGSTATYIVQVSRTKLSAKDILSFSFNDFSPAVIAKIDNTTKTITATVPTTADLSKLKANITISERAKVTPVSDAILDFSKPVSFTVTAEDGSTQVYTATITKEAPVSTSSLPSSITYISNPFRVSVKSTIKLIWEKGVLMKTVENEGTRIIEKTFKRDKNGLITEIETKYDDGTILSDTYTYSADKKTITVWKTLITYNEEGLLVKRLTPSGGFGKDVFFSLKWDTGKKNVTETDDGSLSNFISSWTDIKNPLWEITKQTQFLLIDDTNYNTIMLYLGEKLPVNWSLKYISGAQTRADITPTLDSQGRITRIVVNQGYALAQDMSISYE